jgi:gliding motility-associated-like protein
VTGISNAAVTGQSGNPITEKLINTTNAPVTATYIITPSANGCTGTAFTYSIVVNPTATISSSSSAIICSDAAQDYKITSPASGTTYSWSREAVAGISNNAVTGQTANPITETLTNTTNAPVTVTYIITPSANRCTGTPFSYIVTVNPRPKILSVQSNSPICTGSRLNLNTPSIEGATYKWIGPDGFSSTLQNPTILNTILENAGTYSVTATVNGCTSLAGTGDVIINATPATPKISNNSPLCEGSTLQLTASSIQGAYYTWVGPAGFTSTIQNPSIPAATFGNSGRYFVKATVSGCTSLPDSSNVVVNENPKTPTVTSNSPVCTGSDILLKTSATKGATYRWTGPNGFTASLQNLVIANAGMANGGTYSVSVRSEGCPGIGSGAIAVTVNQTPNPPTLSNNGPVCAGSSLKMFASAIADATFYWTGPNGFTSTSQNPVIDNVTTDASGTYSVTVTVKGCTSTSATTNVVIKSLPSAPIAKSNAPVCDGYTVKLTASAIDGAIYNWTGPGDFTSATQNPTIANATFTNAGKYYVSATVNGCTGPVDSANVIINSNPIPPNLSGNSPVCSGGSIKIAAATVTGADYTWTGPNGFNSSSQNITISNAKLSDGGTYRVSITAAGCPSTTSSSIDIKVNQTPAAPAATNDGPVCEQSTLHLSASSPVTGATYKWTGPDNFITTTPNPAISNVTSTAAGKYSVTVNVNGCTSDSAKTLVVVKKLAIASAGNNQTVCANNALVNIAGTVKGGSNTGIWSTTGSGSFSPDKTSLHATYAPTAADKASGQVTLTLTSTNNNGCQPSSSSLVVAITDSPTASAGGNKSVCDNKAHVTLNGWVKNATGGVWSTSGSGTFRPSDTSLNATYIPGLKDITRGSAILALTTTGNGNCLKVSDNIIVTITHAPVVNAGPDQFILQSGSAVLQPVVSGSNPQYLWSPNKYLNNNIIKNPLVTGVEDMQYTLKVTDMNGCVNEDKVMVKVLMPFKIPNTFTPNNDGINDKWSIPNLNNYPAGRVQVFNRYGQLVFESIGYAEPWDGTMHGKPLPFGTYYYVIEAGSGRRPFTGYVTLVK